MSIESDLEGSHRPLKLDEMGAKEARDQMVQVIKLQKAKPIKKVRFQVSQFCC